MKTNSASLTFLGPAASDGLFTTAPVTHIVVEPPPSRFSASMRLRRRASACSSASVMPGAEGGLTAVYRDEPDEAVAGDANHGPRVAQLRETLD